MNRHKTEKAEKEKEVQVQVQPQPPTQPPVEEKPKPSPLVHNHADVPRLTPAEASAMDEPEDNLELRTARSKMGFKLTVDGPHTVLLLLTEYDLSKQCYWGVTIRSHGEVGEKLPVIQAVSGYKAFDADPRTDMLFVELEDDTAKIRNRLRHLAAREPEVQEVIQEGDQNES